MELTNYDNSEMYIQAMKARMSGDNHTLNRISSAKSPGEMKALGTKVNKFNPEVWAKSLMDIAIYYLHAKFTQNKIMANCLLATCDNVLVEESPNDKLWGIGLSMFDPMTWAEIVQGKALMQVWKTIREASSYQNTTYHISKKIIM